MMNLNGERVFVTGGLGLIGTDLVLRCLELGAELVSVYDRLPLTERHPLASCAGDPRLRVIQGDLLDLAELKRSLAGHDWIAHLGASTQMRWSDETATRDLNEGFIASVNVLEAMRQLGVREILFSSSSAVYGDLAAKPVQETDGPLLPKSAYGAAKLAAEGWISAHCHLFDLRALVFRLGNVIGPRLDRGVIYDCIRKLRSRPAEIEVYGDGTQGRTYILVKDFVDAMLHVRERVRGKEVCGVYNVSGLGLVRTVDVIRITCGALGLPEPSIRHPSAPIGWPGDVPVVQLDLSRLTALGWKLTSSAEAVRISAQGIASYF